jgi:hypothetical protein
MALKIPPAPTGSPPGSAFWNDWYEKLRNLINSGTISQLWSSIDFTASNITDIVTRAHNNLQSFQGGTAGEYYHLTQAQHTSLTGLPTLASGTYTPTLTNVTNVSASTAYACQYLRVGNVVTVSGKIDYDPTAGGAIELGITLPVASNFTATEQCAGTGVSVISGDGPLWIQADTTNDRASFRGVATDLTNHAGYFTFTYSVL